MFLFLHTVQKSLNPFNITSKEHEIRQHLTGVGESGDLEEKVFLREALGQHEEGGRHRAL